MSADSDLSLPDSQSILLPARAYLLSLRDQNLPLRRVALEDAEEHFASVDGTDLHKTQLATVAVIGEALQVLEDVAALGQALLTSPLGLPFYVSATSYSPRSVNNWPFRFEWGEGATRTAARKECGGGQGRVIGSVTSGPRRRSPSGRCGRSLFLASLNALQTPQNHAGEDDQLAAFRPSPVRRDRRPSLGSWRSSEPP